MIYIALGANLPSQFGTPSVTLKRAMDALRERGIEIIDVSRTWLTAPVPISDQPWFHNIVISVTTTQSPQDLLSSLLSIEKEFGRVRAVQNEARVLDLDIIAYHDEIITEDYLTIPHPRLHERAFVLLPLQDIAPEWVHPVSKKSIVQLIEQLPSDQIARPEAV
jgi:2-amino-4-hydroxy-6-hydroxymethyldihydropteridine diphosphokinase